MLLTKSSVFLIGPIASLLGYIMNAIFWVQSQIGWENIGLCIILFTFVIYLFMTPLTIQQQKFSKLSARMSPELDAIQKKYKGKDQDQAAMLKMNEETQNVYAKYGVNPMGSCLQLIVQMPILFGLYQVIWNIPAYVTRVKNVFLPLADALMKASGAKEFLTETARSLSVRFGEMTQLTVVDVLYKFRSANWAALGDQFPALSTQIAETQSEIGKMNYFFGLNIADAPSSIFMNALHSGEILMCIGAALIPILAALTQWLNVKLMDSMNGSSNADNAKKDDSSNSMGKTMKIMNNIMPIMSAVFCLTLPVGMGIYWIAAAVIRSLQQVVINKHLEKMDIDELVKKNLEKINKKRAKQGLPPQKATSAATVNTKSISTDTNTVYVRKSTKAELQEQAGKVPEANHTSSSSNYKPGSLAAKANMVKEYNETHGKK